MTIIIWTDLGYDAITDSDIDIIMRLLVWVCVLLFLFPVLPSTTSRARTMFWEKKDDIPRHLDILFVLLRSES